jgi:hypothetical protein
MEAFPGESILMKQSNKASLIGLQQHWVNVRAGMPLGDEDHSEVAWSSLLVPIDEVTWGQVPKEADPDGDEPCIEQHMVFR